MFSKSAVSTRAVGEEGGGGKVGGGEWVKRSCRVRRSGLHSSLVHNDHAGRVRHVNSRLRFV